MSCGCGFSGDTPTLLPDAICNLPGLSPGQVTQCKECRAAGGNYDIVTDYCSPAPSEIPKGDWCLGEGCKYRVALYGIIGGGIVVAFAAGYLAATKM